MARTVRLGPPQSRGFYHCIYPQVLQTELLLPHAAATVDELRDALLALGERGGGL